VRRLLGERGRRYEPITYWTTLGDRALLPGPQRLVARLALIVRGKAPDGFLVRVSTVGMPLPEALAIQAVFIGDLLSSVPAELGDRLMGVSS
jgi:hypothetical protein